MNPALTKLQLQVACSWKDVQFFHYILKRFNKVNMRYGCSVVAITEQAEFNELLKRYFY